MFMFIFYNNKYFGFSATCVLEQGNPNLKPDGKVWKPFECDIPGDIGYNFELVNGVFQVMSCKKVPNGDTNGGTKKSTLHPYPCIDEFMEDQKFLLALSTHGPV